MAKSTSKSKQASSSAYASSSRWHSNRMRKLKRQLKLQPGNAQQIETAMGNISYRRGKPVSTQWSHGNIRLAQLFKYFAGAAPKELFSANPKVQQAALQALNARKLEGKFDAKVSFSLAARAHDKAGRLVWA